MQNHWNDISTVTLKRYDGKETVFPSLDDAVLGVYGSHIEDLKYGYLRTYLALGERGIWWKGDDFIFLDECGLVIPLWKVKEAHRNISDAERRERLYGRISPRLRRWYGFADFKFRDGPVPYIRRRRWHRNPRANVQTTQEMRENDFFINFDEDAREYRIKARPSRSRKNLPTAWDDRPRGSFWQKSWKHFRKHQWKAK